MPVFQKLNFIYNIITCNSEPQEQSGVMSGSWTNHSFEPVLFGELVELVEQVQQIKLNHLKQLAVQGAQIQVTQSKLNFGRGWQSLGHEISQNNGVYDPVMLVLPTHSVLQFLQQSLNWRNSFNLDRGEDGWAGDTSMRELSTWMKRRNQSFMVSYIYVKMWADVIIIIIIWYIYIVLFWVLKALYIEVGNLLIHHQCAASTWIAPERPPHTSLLVERRQSDEANQCMGMIRRPWWSEANGEIWPGCRVTPLLFFEGHPGIFNDHRESGPRFNVSSEGRAFYSIVSPSLM